MDQGWMQSVGDALADVVERASRSVVQVAAPRRTSGTVWSDELVVASAHATRADDATVLVHGGEERRAIVIGRDLATDVAVLRVEGGGLAPMSFADASAVRAGHLAVALGRPTRGVRAALSMVALVAHDQPTRVGSRLPRWIEIDRELPSGFTGGPLVDARGDAIGMSTSALARRVALAVPREVIARVVREILDYGQVRRGWLGIAVRPSRLPEALAEHTGQRSGAVVTAVHPGSPAERAGLATGDVICSVEGCAVRGPEDLLGMLWPRVGATLRLSIVREGALDERSAETIARAI